MATPYSNTSHGQTTAAMRFTETLLCRHRALLVLLLLLFLLVLRAESGRRWRRTHRWPCPSLRVLPSCVALVACPSLYALPASAAERAVLNRRECLKWGAVGGGARGASG